MDLTAAHNWHVTTSLDQGRCEAQQSPAYEARGKNRANELSVDDLEFDVVPTSDLEEHKAKEWCEEDEFTVELCHGMAA